MLYRIFMPKTGISVTLRDDNLLWLKGRARATGSKSLSETLDELVTAARAGGRGPVAAVRSVAGTVDVGAGDPGLERADEYIRELFTASHNQPFLVRETPPDSRGRARKKRRG